MTEPFTLTHNHHQIHGEIRYGNPLIVFCHGFGVERTSQGMFTDIANSLPSDYGYILFDYYDISDDTWRVAGLDAMSKILEKVVEFAERFTKNITIIAHSQGCSVTALAKPKYPMIFLAPPTRTMPKNFKKFFVASREDRCTVDDLGNVILIRKRDSKKLIISADWFNHDERNLAFESMKQLASDITIIEALEDESIKDRRKYKTLEKLGAKKIQLHGNHNFDPPHRTDLINHVLTLL